MQENSRFQTNPKIAKTWKNLGKIFIPWFKLENGVEILLKLERLGRKSLWECLGIEKIGENLNE